jgi:nitrate reductase NapE component
MNKIKDTRFRSESGCLFGYLILLFGLRPHIAVAFVALRKAVHLLF